MTRDRQQAALDRLRAKGNHLAPVMVDGKVRPKGSSTVPAGRGAGRGVTASEGAPRVIIPPVQNKTLSKPFPGDGISFAIEGEPVSKGRPRFSQRGGKVRTYTPAKTLNAEQAVADAFRAAAPGYTYAPDGAYQVDVVFVSGTRRQRDVDNMLKLILDGLNGIAWADDHQVLRTVAEKGYDPGNARTVVTIRRVDVMAA